MLIEDCHYVSITEFILSSIFGEACCSSAFFWGKKPFEKFLPLFLFSFGLIRLIIHSTSVLYVGMSSSSFLQ